MIGTTRISTAFTSNRHLILDIKAVILVTPHCIRMKLLKFFRCHTFQMVLHNQLNLKSCSLSSISSLNVNTTNVTVRLLAAVQRVISHNQISTLLRCLVIETVVKRNATLNHRYVSSHETKRQLTWHKLSHQTKHFCSGSAFLSHNNSVLAPLKPQTFETGLQSGIF